MKVQVVTKFWVYVQALRALTILWKEHALHGRKGYCGEKAVEGGSWNMCKIIDDYIKKGEERGKEIGAATKEAEVNERVATDMIRDKKPLEEILKYSKLPEAAIRELAKSMGVAVL